MSAIENQTVVDQVACEIQNLHIAVVNTTRPGAVVSTQITPSDYTVLLEKLRCEKDNEISFLKNQLKLEQDHNEKNLEQANAYMENLKVQIEGWKFDFMAKAKETDELKKELQEKNLRIQFVEEGLLEANEKLEAMEKECKKVELVMDTVLSKANYTVQKINSALQAALNRVKELEEEIESKENHLDGKMQVAQIEFDKKMEDLAKEHSNEMDELEEDKNQEIESLKFEIQRKIQEIMERHAEKMEELESCIKRQENEIQELEDSVEGMKKKKDEDPVYEKFSEDENKPPTASPKAPICCSTCKGTASTFWRIVNGSQVKCDSCFSAWMKTAGCTAGANIKYFV